MCAKAGRNHKGQSGRKRESGRGGLKEQLRSRLHDDVVSAYHPTIGHLLPSGVCAINLADELEIREECVKFHMAPLEKLTPESLEKSVVEIADKDAHISFAMPGGIVLAEVAYGRGIQVGSRGDKLLQDIAAGLRMDICGPGIGQYSDCIVLECREVTENDWIAKVLVRWPAKLRNATVASMLATLRKPDTFRTDQRASRMKKIMRNSVSIGHLSGRVAIDADDAGDRPVSIDPAALATTDKKEDEAQALASKDTSRNLVMESVARPAVNTPVSVPRAVSVDAAGLMDDEYDAAREEEDGIALEFLRTWKSDKVSGEEARAEIERQREEIRAAREELDRERKEFEEERSEFEEKMAQHKAAMEAQLGAAEVISSLKDDYVERMHRMKDSLADLLSCVDEILDYYESPIEIDDDLPAEEKPRTPLEKQLAANARDRERRKALIERQKEKMRSRKDGVCEPLAPSGKPR